MNLAVVMSMLVKACISLGFSLSERFSYFGEAVFWLY